MSLRARLLIAIGVIAIVALAVVDVVTYSALSTYLYQRVDQQLDQSQGRYEFSLDNGVPLVCFAAPGVQPGGDGGGGGGGGPGNPSVSPTFQSPAVQVRSASGGVVDGQNCPANVNGTAYSPDIPRTLPGLAGGGGQHVVYFNAAATRSGAMAAAGTP